MELNPLLKLDFYKTTHISQYHPTITKLVSYYTPRMSRLKDENRVVFFGLQGFIKEYLIEDFNKNFFSRPLDDVVAEYERLMDNTLDKYAYNIEKIKALHQLGYLPLEIHALPEGSLVDVHVPLFEVTNTHRDFAWLVQTIETAMSATLWHAMISANVGVHYRRIVDKYYAKSVDDNVDRRRALGDFSMRGQESIESAIKSSAGWLLSFLNTATVPAIPWLEKYYNCDCTKEPVGFGAISTEHSVMCSNFAIDGDEITFIRRLLTKLYPKQSFSVVSDSYDYWNLVENILPQLKKEIMEHDGTMLIRGDSGDPVEVVTKTVFKLWDIFGGTTNSKGYKVLNPHIKAIYGDSITPQRCEQIYQILIENGFACNNVSLGVGSFSMQCLEEYDESGDVHYAPYTRDTFGVAIKATYAQDKDGNPIPIFKNPKESTFKKSQRGCCSVLFTPHGYRCRDGLTFQEAHNDINNMLTLVFRNGNMVDDVSLSTVRNTLDSFRKLLG